MQFEWDEVKSRSNRLKHGITFEAAMLVFRDPLAVSWLDRVQDGELRWQMVGSSQGIELLLVAFAYREEDGDEIIRIISARKASLRERRAYEEGT